MKKFFTLFAAMLLALTAWADTDFSTPYYCAADDAVLSRTISANNFYLYTASEPHYIAWSDAYPYDATSATWTVTASKACYVTVSLDLGPAISSNKHIFEVKILKGSTLIGTVAEGEVDPTGATEKNTEADQVKTLNGKILLPESGEYTIVLRNIRGYGKGSVKNVILTYVADAPAEYIEVSSVSLDKTELALEVDEVELLTATVLPDNAYDPTVTWTSSDPLVATVSNTGLVTAVAAGTATITATAGDNKTATCEVTVAAATAQNTDFSDALSLTGKKAHLAGNIWKNDSYQLYGDGAHNSQYGTASWTIHVTKPCIVTGTVNVIDKKSLFVLNLYHADDVENSIGYIAQPYAKRNNKGEIALDSVGHSTLVFPTAGDYTLILSNTVEWSSGVTTGVTLTKATYLTPLYLKAGEWNKDGAKFGVYDKDQDTFWPEFMELVEGDVYVIPLYPEEHRNMNFVRFNSSKVSPSDGDIWNQIVDQYRTNDNNCFKVTSSLYSTGEFRKYYPTVSEAGYYLVGTHNSWVPTAADKMVENVEGVEYKISKTVATGDQFKAIALDGDKLLTNWYPSGTGNEYTIPSELAGNVNIYFRPATKDDWSDENGGGKYFLVQKDSGTSIDEINAADKAVKVLENGQMYIIKNGVRYNVLGAVVQK